MQLDEKTVRKLVRGERAGTAATLFCGAVLVFLGAALIYFAVTGTESGSAARIATFVTAPALIAAGAGFAAFCNLRYGGALDKIIREYVRSVLTENARLMHPERDNLTFYISLNANSAELKVNNYKEIINFDFSAFGKLTFARKSFIAAEIGLRLTVTFIKLAVERDAGYDFVSYVQHAGAKNGKPVFIIDNGNPDKRAYKVYLKNG